MSEQENEPDQPNTVAIYIIIVICLLTVVATIWGLSEYQKHTDKKRQDAIEQSQFEKRQASAERDAANKAIIENKLNEIKKGEIPGL
jgi:predicted Holliday junction resolvase-like endonuclease